NGSEDEATASFWTGEELLAVPLDLELEAENLGRVMRYIDSHFPPANIRRETTNSWRPAGKNSWKDLLLNHRLGLEKLGVLIEFGPGFRHAYVAPERWHVALKQGGGEWQLELDLLVDEKKYDLFPLLEQL